VFHVTDVDIIPVSGLDTDGPGIRRFDAWADLFSTAVGHDLGAEPDERSAHELRVASSNPAIERIRYAARTPSGATIGALDLAFPLQDNTSHAFLRVAVDPGARRCGIGARLADLGEDLARARGRRTVQGQVAAAPEPDVPSPGAAFARARGYTLAQTLIRSDVSTLAAAGALAPPPAGYRIETVVGALPDAWLAAYALFQQRMSTDIPLGELALEEEAWDVERVAAHRDRLIRMGRTCVITMAVDAAGAPVGFTEIQHHPSLGALAYQQDTLVLGEYRGYGLGLILKATNLAALREALPGVETVRTWNADDNTHMLAVNTALGYRLTGLLTEWQLRLA